MKNHDNADKEKASKVITPKQFNRPGRKMPDKSTQKPDKTTEKKVYCNQDLVDPDVDPNEIIPVEDMEEVNSILPGKKFSDREQKLIELFLQFPLLPKYQLAQMAGFKAVSKKALCSVFGQVMVKLDSARDHKDIFRQIGFGVVQIALRLKDLAMQDSNLTVALNASVQAARCMEMQKSDLGVEEGFSVTVTRAAQQAQPTATGPKRKGADSEKKKEITR